MKIGILGTGNIAHQMAKTITMMHEELYAVASRDIKRAEAFAQETGATKAYGCYDDLTEDPNVELVYVATPHSEHTKDIMLCLFSGKPVLCEKAFTANAGGARGVCCLAEKENLLLTEAIWTRYLPSRTIINDLLKEIGEVRMVTANLCYKIDQVKRIVDPALAGGALLDVGVYPLNFMLMVLGDNFISYKTTAALTESGVDQQNSTTFLYPNGVLGCIQSGTQYLSDRRGLIYGTKGTIEVENINNPSSIKLLDMQRNVVKDCVIPPQLTGYEYELASAIKAVKEGRTECPEMSHAETIRVMEIMDSLRSDWGVRYPFE